MTFFFDSVYSVLAKFSDSTCAAGVSVIPMKRLIAPRSTELLDLPGLGHRFELTLRYLCIHY